MRKLVSALNEAWDKDSEHRHTLRHARLAQIVVPNGRNQAGLASEAFSERCLGKCDTSPDGSPARSAFARICHKHDCRNTPLAPSQTDLDTSSDLQGAESAAICHHTLNIDKVLP